MKNSHKIELLATSSFLALTLGLANPSPALAACTDPNALVFTTTTVISADDTNGVDLRTNDCEEVTLNAGKTVSNTGDGIVLGSNSLLTIDADIPNGDGKVIITPTIEAAGVVLFGTNSTVINKGLIQVIGTNLAAKTLGQGISNLNGDGTNLNTIINDTGGEIKLDFSGKSELSAIGISGVIGNVNVENKGAINITNPNGAVSEGISVFSTGSVKNSTGGTISVDVGALSSPTYTFSATGINVAGDSGTTITNDGTVSVTGALASTAQVLGYDFNFNQVYIDTPTAGMIGVVFDAGTFTNNNSISVNNAGDGATMGVNFATGSVTNAGTISVDNTSTGSEIGIFHDTTTNVTIDNSGTITATDGILAGVNFSAVETVTNLGTINGKVSLGLGNDILTNTNKITGVVDLGAGDDKLIISGSTVLDGTTSLSKGGAGTDTLETSGTVAVDGAKFTEFEILDVKSGAATLSGTQGYTSGITLGASSNLTISSGASITAALTGDANTANALTNSGTLTGNVALGGGVDVFNNTGGTITGSVDLGAGAETLDSANLGTVTGGINMGADGDTLNISTGTALTANVDGGGGSDTLNVNETHTLAAGKAAGFETTNVAAAKTLTITGDHSSNLGSINLGSGSTLVNEGTIGANPGSVTDSTVVTGIVIQGGSGSETITNKAGATIYGSVDTAGGNDTVTVAGNLYGNVTMGDGDDTFTVSGSGKITGTVDSGSGAETNGDTINLAGSNYTYDVAKFIGFESGDLSCSNISGGSVTIDAAVVVEDDCDINNSADLTIKSITGGTGDNAINLTGEGKITLNPSTGKIDLGAHTTGDSIAVNSDKATAISGDITNTETLTVSGGGVFTYSGTASFNSATVTSSTLNLAGGKITAPVTANGTSTVALDNGSSITQTGGTAFTGDAGAQTLSNKGTVTGDVIFAGGADTLDNTGGSITGNVDFGADADTFTLSKLGTVSGTVTMGTGDDTVIADATSILSIEKVKASTSSADGSDTLSLIGTGHIGTPSTSGTTACDAGFDLAWDGVCYETGSAPATPISGSKVAGYEKLQIDGGAAKANWSLNNDLTFSGGVTLVNDATLSNTAKLTANIAGDTGNNTLKNTSTITGSVDMGAGNDVLENSGTITEAVTMGSGSDMVTVSGEAKFTKGVDGGSDVSSGVDTAIDTLVVNGSIDIKGDDYSGFEKLSVENSGVFDLLNSSKNTISTLSGNHTFSSGIHLDKTAGLAINHSAVIDANITGSDDNNILSNSSTIKGTVSLGKGDDQLIMIGSFGDPTGEVTYFEKTVSGGEGTDTISLLLSGVLDGTNLEGFEKLEMGLEGLGALIGSWTLTGGHNYESVTILSDATSTSTSGGTLNNKGTLSGLVDPNDSTKQTDVTITGSSLNDTVVNSGTIVGNINFGDGVDSLDNTGGTIKGSVDFGDGADVVDGNKLGTITGALTLGKGRDTLNIKTTDAQFNLGVSSIDGGDGYDTMSLDGTGTIGGGADFVNKGFDLLTITGGDWTLKGTQNYQTVFNNTDNKITTVDGKEQKTYQTLINQGTLNLTEERSGGTTVTGSIFGDANNNALNNGHNAPGSIINGHINLFTGNDTIINNTDSIINGSIQFFDTSDNQAADKNIHLLGYGIEGHDDWVWNLGTINAPEGEELTGALISFGSGKDWLSNHGTINGDVDMGIHDDTFWSAGTVNGTLKMGDGADTVDNVKGTITGDLDFGGGDDLFNTNKAGTIGGSLLMGSGNDVLTNTGTFTNNINMGDGADIIKNTGGILEGNVDFGDGADVVDTKDFGTIKGEIRLGAGDDKLTNTQAFDLNPDGTTKTIYLDAGKDTFTNTSSFIGTVDFGDGSDTLDNTNGTITGDVNFGAGNDTLEGSKLGTISGKIDLGDGSDIFINNTTVDKDIYFGDGSDTLQNKEGTINGTVYFEGGDDFMAYSEMGNVTKVEFGDGDDTFEVALGEVTDPSVFAKVSAGAGNDTLQLTGGGSFAGQTSEFESLALNRGGPWTLTGTQSYETIKTIGNVAVTNNATLSGNVFGVSGSQHITNEAGASITGAVDYGAGDDTLINKGTIVGNVSFTGGGKDSFTNTSSIDGTVSLADGFLVLDNTSGTITGKLTLGAGSEAISASKLGTVNGGVEFKGGEDSLTISSSQSIKAASYDGGEDKDTLILTGSGTIAGDKISNFEVLQHNGSDWTLTGTHAYSGGISLGDNASLESQGVLTSSVITGTANTNTLINRGSGDSADSTKITANISLLGGNDSLSNLNATIAGTVDMGDGSDTVDNTGGIITGDLVMGAGNDTLNATKLGTVNGSISLGTGNDILQITSATKTLGKTVVGGSSGTDGTDTLQLLGKGEFNTQDLDHYVGEFEKFTLNGTGEKSEWTFFVNKSTYETTTGDDGKEKTTLKKAIAANFEDQGGISFIGDTKLSIGATSLIKTDFFGDAGNNEVVNNTIALLGASLNLVSGDSDLGGGNDVFTNNGIMQLTEVVTIDGKEVTENKDVTITMGEGNDKFTNNFNLGGANYAAHINMGLRHTEPLGWFSTTLDIKVADDNDTFENTHIKFGEVNIPISFTGNISTGSELKAGWVFKDHDLVLKTGNDNDTITNSGNITGNIAMDTWIDPTLVNSAKTASIKMGSSNDKLTNSGTIAGNILMGGNYNLSYSGRPNNQELKVKEADLPNIQIGSDNDILVNSGTITPVNKDSSAVIDFRKLALYRLADETEQYSAKLYLNIEDNNTLTNTETGKIEGDVKILFGDGNDTLTNDGTIKLTDYSTDISFGDGTNTLTNGAEATMSADVNFGNDTNNFTNKGSFTGSLRMGSAGASSSGINTFINSGTYSGSISMAGKPANFTNSGTITGNIGINGQTINVTNSGTLSGLGMEYETSASTATVINQGTIGSGIGYSAGNLTLVNGFDTSGLSGDEKTQKDTLNKESVIIKGNIVSTQGSENITNYGTITGGIIFGGSTSENEPTGGGGDRVVNHGSIGAAYINRFIGHATFVGSNDSDYFENHGSITSQVQMGYGDDTFINYGTITNTIGRIDMWGGNDSFANYGDLSGAAILGRDGNDTFIQFGTVNLARYFSLGSGSDTLIVNENTRWINIPQSAGTHLLGRVNADEQTANEVGTIDTLWVVTSANKTFNVNWNLYVNFEQFRKTGGGNVTFSGYANLKQFDLNSGNAQIADTFVVEQLKVQAQNVVVPRNVGLINLASATITRALALEDQPVLSGTGTIIGNVEIGSQGHMAPGNSVGTFNIVGGYVQTEGGTFDLEIDGPTNDLLAITGTAEIAGTLDVLSTFTQDNVDVYDTWEFLTATDGVTGTFDTVNGDTNVFLEFNPIYNANSVEVQLDRLSFVQDHYEPQQLEIAQNLDSLVTLVEAGTATSLVDQFIDDLTFTQKTRIDPYLDQMVNQSAVRSATPTIRSRQAFLDEISESTLEVQHARTPVGSWVSGASYYTEYGTVDKANFGSGYKFKLRGAMATMNYRYSNKAILGFAAGGSSSGTVKENAWSDNDRNSFDAALFGGYVDGTTEISGALAVSLDSYDNTRRIQSVNVNALTKSSSMGHTLSAKVRLKKTIHVGTFSVMGLADLQMTRLKQNGFTETGADGLGLKVDRQTINSNKAMLGLRASYNFEVENNQFFKPFVGAYLEHEFSDIGRNRVANFIANPEERFNLYGVNADRNMIRAEAGFVSSLTDRLSWNVKYTGVIAKTLRVDNISARFTLNW